MRSSGFSAALRIGPEIPGTLLAPKSPQNRRSHSVARVCKDSLCSMHIRLLTALADRSCAAGDRCRAPANTTPWRDEPRAREPPPTSPSSSSCAAMAPARPWPSCRNGADRTSRARQAHRARAAAQARDLRFDAGQSHRAWLTPAPRRFSSSSGPTRRSNTWRSISRRFPHATNPNDSLFASQWYLQGHRGFRGQRHRRLGPRAAAPPASSSPCSIPACSTTIRIWAAATVAASCCPASTSSTGIT